MLEGPIVPTLLRLAVPNLVVNVVLIAVTTSVDAHFVGRLGLDALAGLALVFPLMMLMQQMANIGMGGAIAASIARAIGAGRREDAASLVVHALAIAAGAAALFSAVFLLGGPTIYGWLGGRGPILAAALEYSNVIFAGALAYWILGALTSVVRATGQVAMLAYVYVAAEVLHIALVPALVFGLGPIPALGITGAGLATVIVLHRLVDDARLVPRLGPDVGRPVAARRPLRAPPVRRDPARRRADVAGAGAEQRGTGNAHDLRRLCSGRHVARRFRCGGAAGIPALPAELRPGRGGAGHGRQQHRCAASSRAPRASPGPRWDFRPASWPASACWRSPRPTSGWACSAAIRQSLAAAAGYLAVVGLAYPFVAVNTLMSAFQATRQPEWPLAAMTCRLLIVVVGGWVAIEVLQAGLVGLGMVTALGLASWGIVRPWPFASSAHLR